MCAACTFVCMYMCTVPHGTANGQIFSHQLPYTFDRCCIHTRRTTHVYRLRVNTFPARILPGISRPSTKQQRTGRAFFKLLVQNSLQLINPHSRFRSIARLFFTLVKRPRVPKLERKYTHFPYSRLSSSLPPAPILRPRSLCAIHFP